MSAWQVVLAVLLVFWLIGLIRLKGVVEYTEEGVQVQLRVLWFRITLFPSSPAKKEGEKPQKKPEKPKKPKKTKKTKKPKKPEKPGEEPEEEPEKEPEEEPGGGQPLTEKLGGLWSLFREALPMVCEAAGKLFHKLRIEELTLHLTWAAEDPADAALGYGMGQAALASVGPLLERSFRIRRWDVGVAVDFARSAPIIYARGILSFTLGQLLALGLVYGTKGLGLLLRHRPKRKRARREKGTAGGKERAAAGRDPAVQDEGQG